MPVNPNLIFQELAINPASEWIPRCRGWIIIRVADGGGYWLREKGAGELGAGDGLVLGFDHKTQLRASVLYTMKLQFFTVQPQYLGLLTVEEWHRFKMPFENSMPYFMLFHSNDSIGLEFAELAGKLRKNSLLERCALLQFWAKIVANVHTSPDNSPAEKKGLRKRFFKMLNQMSATEFSTHSLPELAQQLNCSTRYFRYLFCREFGVPFRVRQAELRLLRARQLLVESDATVLNIAGQCGYRHMSFFNRMFKKRFGMTPGQWRRQTQKNSMPALSFASTDRN